MNKNANTTDTSGKRPTHGIFQVIGEQDAARWIRVGSAWQHKRDGKGLNLIFDSFPMVGRIVLREIDYDQQNAGS